MRKIPSLLLSACFLALPLSACGEKDAGGLKKLKINEVTHSIFYAPLYLADALGYFEEENIKIELTNGGGADSVMSAVLSGDSHVGFCGPEAALYVLLGGSTDAPEVFGQLTQKDGSFLVSRIEEPNFQWTDLKGKEILAGRKGGVPAMTFEYVLKEHNLFDGVDLTLNYDVAFNLMTSAFEGGTADYCTMFEPVASEYQAAGKGYIVASVGEASGDVPYTCFTAKKSWLKKNSETADGLLRAVMKATKYLHETPSSQVAPYLTDYFASTPVSSIQTALESYLAIDAWSKNMAMTKESFERLQDIMQNAGELTTRVDFEDLVDTQRALKIYEEVY